MYALSRSLLALAGIVLAATAQNTTKIPLRIMPVGASVTFGVGSTTGNSYRKDLRDMLVAQGFEVNMVGEKNNGNFADNDVEAVSGFTIAQIAKLAQTGAPRFLPNLVLLDAGTNNCNNGGTFPSAGQDVGNIIDLLYKQSPGVTVVLTTILQNKIATQDACRVDINKQYQALATKLIQQKAKFVLVDMRDGGPTVNDLFDSRHPNDVGYQKMATVWNRAFQEVLSKGYLTAAADNGIPADGDQGNSTSKPTGRTRPSTVAGVAGSLHASWVSVGLVTAACALFMI